MNKSYYEKQKEELNKKLVLIQAYLDGKEIEYRPTITSPWETGKEFTFLDPSTLYRIKPEPEKLYAFKSYHNSSQQIIFFSSENPKEPIPLTRVPEFDIEYKE